MLVELRLMSQAQTKAVDVAMKKLRISQDGRLGKLIIRFVTPKETASQDCEEMVQ